MKAQAVILLFLLLLLYVSLPVKAQEIETRYMRSDLHTVNGKYGYILGLSQSTLYRSFLSGSQTEGQTAYWGMRVFIRHAGSPYETELTDGVQLICQRDADGAGIQMGEWNCSETDVLETDALFIQPYVKVGDGDWGAGSYYITEQLDAVQILEAEWEVYFYTERIQNGKQVRLYWGDADHNSRIENIQLESSEAMWYVLLVMGAFSVPLCLMPLIFFATRKKKARLK